MKSFVGQNVEKRIPIADRRRVDNERALLIAVEQSNSRDRRSVSVNPLHVNLDVEMRDAEERKNLRKEHLGNRRNFCAFHLASP